MGEDLAVSRAPIEVQLRIRRVALLTASVIGLLALANIPAAIVANEADRFYFDHPTARLFLLDSERNIPTLWACLQLAACALLAVLHALVSRVDRVRDAWRWVFMAGLFSFLTLDEGLQIHEFFDDAIVERIEGAEGIVTDWTFVAVPLVLLIALPFLRWVLRQHARLRAAFLIGGTMFVMGAVVLEYAADRLVAREGFGGPLYPVLASTEEMLELVGVWIVLLALLEHLGRRLAGRAVVVEHAGPSSTSG